MSSQLMTFDEVFKIWLETEVSSVFGKDILSVAQSKGFSSIAGWRLATALRLGMDKKEWNLEVLSEPNKTLPLILIGPFVGWQQFFSRKLETAFAQALENQEFFSWCQTHNRVQPLTKDFPKTTTLILFRKPSGELIHIEGGHRICAVAYAQKIGQPVNFEGKHVNAAIADLTDAELPALIEFLHKGTNTQG